MDDAARGTLDRVQGRQSGALAELATLHGRSLVGVAFAVLQNLPASEKAAAHAIAECWRMEPDAWPRDADQVAHELLGAAARAALFAHGDISEVDPTPRPGAADLLRLTPRQRALAALAVLGGMEPVAAATRLRSRTGTRDGSEIFSSEIAAAVVANVAGLPANVTADAVHEALAVPPAERRTRRRRSLLLAGGVIAAGLLAAVVATRPAPEPADGVAVQPSSSAASVIGDRPRSGGRLTLADCGIGPPDATLAFSGWVTPRRLGLSSTDLQPGRAVLALVPEGEVAWNPPGGPRIMPPVRGRMACLSDAADGTLMVVGLPAGWTPPGRVPRFPGGPIEGPDGGPRSSDTG